MSRRRRHVGGCVLAIAALASTWSVAIHAANRALLIGINDYAAEHIPDLRGAVNDVELVKHILETRFGFAPEHVRMLTNADANREAILAALDDLAAKADPQDTIYVHYSGHGSRRPDDSGDEEDGFDETILSHDARTEGVPDILDDELDQRFARFRSDKVLIVFDSCHSGTITRGVVAQRLASMYGTAARALTPVLVRSVAPDTRDALYSNIRTRDVVQVGELKHVLMTGAPAEQEALDGPVGDGWYGLFSYALARSLDALGPEASAVEVHDRVREELRAVQASLNVVTPEPQLEAPADLLESPPLARSDHETDESDESDETYETDADVASDKAWLAATRISEDRVLLIDGASLNAVLGSQWAVYPSEETHFDFGHALAAGTVQAHDGANAVLLIQRRASSIPETGKAVQLMAADTWREITVRFLGPTESRVDRLMALMAGADFTVAAPQDYPRFVLELAEGRWTVRDAGGLSELIEFPDAADADVAPALADTMRNASSGFAFLALDNPGSEIDLRVAVLDSALVDTGDMPVRGVTVRQSSAHPSYFFRQADEPRSARNSLKLEVFSNTAGYLTIVHVDTHGATALLFPNPHQRSGYLPDGMIPADTRVHIPDSFDSANRAGFHWDYGPPAGRDTLRVFLSESLDTATLIRRSAGSGLESVRELRGVLSRVLMRGIVTSPSDEPAGNQDWTVRTVVIDVGEPPSPAEVD